MTSQKNYLHDWFFHIVLTLSQCYCVGLIGKSKWKSLRALTSNLAPGATPAKKTVELPGGPRHDCGLHPSYRGKDIARTRISNAERDRSHVIAYLFFKFGFS